MKALRMVAAGALACVAAACVTPPAPELQGYASAFAEAETAGNLMFDELATLYPPAEGSGGACDTSIDPATGARGCFSVALALGGAAGRRAEHPDISQRREALALIGLYNQLVVDLAEGRSAEALGAKVQEVKSVALGLAALAPGGGGATVLGGLPVDLVSGIAQKAEGLRAANASARSILAARPDIDALIDALIAETPNYYAQVAEAHRAEVRKARGERFGIAKFGTREEQIAFEVKLVSMTDPEGKANRAWLFEQVLVAYVRHLDRTKQALAALAGAIEAPVSTPLSAAVLFTQQVTEARIEATRFLDAARRLRSAPGGG